MRRRKRLSACRTPPFPVALLLLLLIVSASAAADHAQDTIAAAAPPPGVHQEQKQYNETLAKLMVDLCGCSYCCIKDCSAWTCETCKKHPTFNVTELQSSRMRDGHGFVAYDPPPSNTIYVAFTGTDPLTLVDYFDDIDFLKAPYPGCDGCLVHRGFYLDWMELREEVLGAVKAYYYQDHDQQQQQLSSSKAMATEDSPPLLPSSPPPSTTPPRIQVTGHSLGGTMAVYAALDVIRTLGLPVDTLITFGQPRMGNAAFRDFVHATTTRSSCAYFRVTHHRDPIVHLPGVLLGFHHAGQEIFYPKPAFRGGGTSPPPPPPPGGGGGDDYIVCRNTTTATTTMHGILPREDDPNCSAQYLVDLNLIDHLTYLDFPFTENYIACNLLQQEKEIEERQIAQQATYARRQQGHQRLLLRGQE